MRDSLSELSPAYFAMVMATGIVSVALRLEGFPSAAMGLFRLNIVFFAALWSLYLARLSVAPGRFLADLKDHNRAPGFFTVVAGTCVLGNQFVLIASETRAATALWVLGTALWFILLYTVFTCLTIKQEKPPSRRGSTAAGSCRSWRLSRSPSSAASSPGTSRAIGRRACSSALQCGSGAGCSMSGSSR
jgi:tellurite resistance protein TehA-like permease